MKPLPPVNLQESAERVQHHAATITKIEQDAQRKTLLPRLLIGLHCLKAHTMFALVDVSKKNKHNRNKKQAPATELTTSSYKTWLYTADHTLKEPTTYKYMSAVRGLGCDQNSTEEELTTVFKTYTNPTLAMLCNAATEPVQPTTPPKEEQLEFDLLRSCLKSTRQQCEELVATADRIREYPELHKAAVGRLYKTLKLLTGTSWAPSDEENEYDHIDPDQFSL